MKHTHRIFGLFLILFASLSLIFHPAYAQSDNPLAIIITADGPIMPPMYEYIKRGINTAEQQGAEVLIIAPALERFRKSAL